MKEIMRHCVEKTKGWTSIARPSQLRRKTMPPHPKRKHSKSRRDMRRAHDALQPTNLVACSNCGSMRLPHTVCSNCGFYEGREVIEVKKEKKKAE